MQQKAKEASRYSADRNRKNQIANLIKGMEIIEDLNWNLTENGNIPLLVNVKYSKYIIFQHHAYINCYLKISRQAIVFKWQNLHQKKVLLMRQILNMLCLTMYHNITWLKKLLFGFSKINLKSAVLWKIIIIKYLCVSYENNCTALSTKWWIKRLVLDQEL